MPPTHDSLKTLFKSCTGKTNHTPKARHETGLAIVGYYPSWARNVQKGKGR